MKTFILQMIVLFSAIVLSTIMFPLLVALSRYVSNLVGL